MQFAAVTCGGAVVKTALWMHRTRHRLLLQTLDRPSSVLIEKSKKISDHLETLKSIGMQRMIRSVEVAELAQWRNARVVEVAVNVTEKQND